MTKSCDKFGATYFIEDFIEMKQSSNEEKAFFQLVGTPNGKVTPPWVDLKDPPPLDCKKTPLGTKSRRTHGLF